MLLNGLFEQGCHQATCFSTYHDIVGGVCRWCHRTEASLLALGRMWTIQPAAALAQNREKEPTT